MKKVALLSAFFAAVSVAKATADTVQGFVYTAGTFTTFDLPGVAHGINDAGQIVGFLIPTAPSWGSCIPGAPLRPSVPPPGARYPAASIDINDAGQIVGAIR